MPRKTATRTESSKVQKRSLQLGTERDGEPEQPSSPNESTSFADWFRSLVPIIRFVSVWLSVLYGFALFGFVLAKTSDGLIYPNTLIGPYNLGGYRPSDAQAFLQERFSEFQTHGIEVAAAERSIWIHANVSGVADPDLSYELYAFDPEATVEDAFRVGRSGSWIQRGVQVVAQYFNPRIVDPVIRVNHDQLIRFLKENFHALGKPATVPEIKLINNPKTPPEVVIVNIHPTPGETFDYESTAMLVADRIRTLSRDQIVVHRVPSMPSFSSDELEVELPVIRGRLQVLFTGAEFVFATSTSPTSTRISLPHNELASMITLERGDGSVNQRVRFGLNDRFEQIVDRLDMTFGRPIQEAKFVVTNGRVSEFQQAQHGIIVLKQPLRNKVIDLLNEIGSQPFIQVEVAVQEAVTRVSDVNDLGIREIIGVGRSNFKGSPTNRRHNIKVGAAAVNGSLIAPGKEFSLLKTLGDISSTTGYLPELVIKGDRTIPEYGGGLCQIGTTTFRGALDSGLDITARTNHSYRVTYYEPAGTDATIYDPSPDFRFLNDTGNYILIQTRIEGDEAIFEFWGTKDGRTVERTKPRIYNIVSPPETKYVETTDLKPGEEKCTERAHAGADAEFTYSVTYPSGEVKEEVFKSHYRPWQAVCLKGVASSSTTTPEAL